MHTADMAVANEVHVEKFGNALLDLVPPRETRECKGEKNDRGDPEDHEQDECGLADDLHGIILGIARATQRQRT
jgi:hypothetical protein